MLNMLIQSCLKMKVCSGNMRVTFICPISSLQPLTHVVKEISVKAIPVTD